VFLNFFTEIRAPYITFFLLKALVLWFGHCG